MGYSISWLAVRGKTAADLHRQLGLRATGKREQVPESPLLSAEIAGGWSLIFANRCDFADSLPLAKLSAGAEVITCMAEEHVMTSSATGWKDGKLLWSITHDWQQGKDHLKSDGAPPPAFNGIRDRLIEKQTEPGAPDYLFDIPVEVAKSLTGFRHDEDVESDLDDPFELLEPDKPWWRFWR